VFKQAVQLPSRLIVIEILEEGRQFDA